MTRQLIKGMTMLLVALAFCTASAYGQSTRSSAQIPFDFTVGSETLSAGRYNISNATPEGKIVKIEAAKEQAAVMRLTSRVGGGAAAESSKLVFHKYGNRYFLAEIWTAGEPGGQKLMKSREEKALERELASTTSKSDLAQLSYERVEVAMGRSN